MWNIKEFSSKEQYMTKGNKTGEFVYRVVFGSESR